MNILADFVQTPPEETSGIYAFVSEENETVYYIGQSKNIKNRYSSHTVRQFLKSKSLAFKFIWKRYSTSQLDTKEYYYINSTSPILNTLLNGQVDNNLKSEYQDLIRKTIEKEIEIIAINLQEESNLNKQPIEDLAMCTLGYNHAKLREVYSLLKCIEIGSHYSTLKQLLRSAPNKKIIYRTNMGTYNGWTDFCEKHNHKIRTIDDYIFMYKHRQEFKEMRLISKDPVDLASGVAGHRKIASIKAVRWYLKRIEEEGEHIRGTLTACDYQEYIQSKAKAKIAEEEAKPDYKRLYEQLRTENELLKLQINSLEARLAKAERSGALQIA